MAQEKPKKQLKEVKKKKKKWISILAPKEFKSVEIGEAYVEEAEQCLNRIVKVNLMTLLRDPKKQNTSITFKVTDIKENKAYTSLYGFELIPAHVKRLSKKAKSKADDSFLCKSKDNQKLRVKTLALAKVKSPRSTLTDLRKEIQKMITTLVAQQSADTFLNEVVRFNVQAQGKKELKKVLPLTAFLVRVAKKE